MRTFVIIFWTIINLLIAGLFAICGRYIGIINFWTTLCLVILVVATVIALKVITNSIIHYINRYDSVKKVFDKDPSMKQFSQIHISGDRYEYHKKWWGIKMRKI